MIVVDSRKLKHDIPHGEGAMIWEGKRLAGIVMREFCADNGVTVWAEEVTAENVKERKSVRVRHCFSAFPLSNC